MQRCLRSHFTPHSTLPPSFTLPSALPIADTFSEIHARIPSETKEAANLPIGTRFSKSTIKDISTKNFVDGIPYQKLYIHVQYFCSSLNNCPSDFAKHGEASYERTRAHRQP